MISTEHKIKRILQLGLISEDFAKQLLDNPDGWVCYGHTNMINSVGTEQDWLDYLRDVCYTDDEDDTRDINEIAADEFENATSKHATENNFHLCSVDEIVDKIWSDKLHGQYINCGYGHYELKHGYVVYS